MREIAISPEIPPQQAVILADRFILTPPAKNYDAQSLARNLGEFYDQVEVVGGNIVRLGFWERKPSFVRTVSDKIVPVKEVVRPFYLRPNGGNLDAFTRGSDDNISVHFLNEALRRNKLASGRYEWTADDLASSEYPLYSVMWDEPFDEEKGTGPSRSVEQLKGDEWLQVPEVQRHAMEAGLLNWSIQCEHRDPQGLVLYGITFINHGGVSLWVASEGQTEASYVQSIGRILDVVYTEGADGFLIR